MFLLGNTMQRYKFFVKYYGFQKKIIFLYKMEVFIAIAG